MQDQTLRKIASSRLTLAAVVVRLLTYLLTVAVLWSYAAFGFAWADAASVYDAFILTVSDFRAIRHLIILTVVMALPVIALVLVAANARSGKPLKGAGYALLRADAILRMVVSAAGLVVSLIILSDSASPFAFSITAELIAMLLTSIAAAGALKTARQIAVDGCTDRRLTYFLPITLILSFCVQAGNLIAVVLANYFPAPQEVYRWYHTGLSPLDHLFVAAGAAGLVRTFLFLLLSLRAKKSLSQPRELLNDE